MRHFTKLNRPVRMAVTVAYIKQFEPHSDQQLSRSKSMVEIVKIKEIKH